MKTYVDGLVGQQKLYSTAFLLLFVDFIVMMLKEAWPTDDAVFSTIPIIGIKTSSDVQAQSLLLMLSLGISFWVSVSLLWWLYSFNKHHPEESLDVDYLPGMLFMPFWVRGLTGFVIIAMWFRLPDYVHEAAISSKTSSGIMVCILIAPLIIASWIKRKFKYKAQS